MKSFKIAIVFLLILFPFASAEEVNLREAIKLYTLVSKAIESSSFTFTLIDMSFAVIPSILGIGALGLGGKMMIYGIERGISGARESFGFVASLGLSAISGGIGQVAIATRAAGAAGLTTSQKIAEFAKGAAIGVADALTRNPLIPLYISQNPYAFVKGSPVKNPEPKPKVVKPPETKPQEPL
ncbi:MAG: hypothetical protein DSY42_04785 [Aquifex sp.]|nr:MAG: hypothetical protein DSY42_04785 [Aquifex sp.]